MSKRLKIFTLSLVLVMLILLTGLASAEITEIKVKTVPNYEVQITPYIDNGGFEALERYRINADEYGDVKVDFNSATAIFNVVVFVKYDGLTLFEERITNHKNGEPIELELVPHWFTPIPTPSDEVNVSDLNVTSNETLEENVSLENSEAVVEGDGENNSLFTGFAVLGGDGLIGKYKFYIAGVVGILVVLFALLLFRKQQTVRRIKLDDNPKPPIVIGKSDKRMPTISVSSDEKPGSNLQRIKDAERKIAEAQEELSKLRDEEKLKFAEQKIRRDQEALARLKRASDGNQ